MYLSNNLFDFSSQLKLIDPQLRTPLIGEVLYFFRIKSQQPSKVQTCAMISLTSAFDTQTRKDTFDVLWICKHQRYENLLVVDVQNIDSLVALLPYSSGEYFLMEDLGNSVATTLAGSDEPGESIV